MEELKWGDPAHKWITPGCLNTLGPGSYKIPSVNDIPLKFKVSLLKVITLLMHPQQAGLFGFPMLVVE